MWDWIMTWTAASSPLLRTSCMSRIFSLSSPKLSCMVSQRSSRTSERSSPCSTAFLCCVTWLLDDEEIVAFMLWSFSSTSISSERGLEGKRQIGVQECLV